jgi:hypothetical protein
MALDNIVSIGTTPRAATNAPGKGQSSTLSTLGDDRMSHKSHDPIDPQHLLRTRISLLESAVSDILKKDSRSVKLMSEEIVWETSFRNAAALAKKTNKLVLASFLDPCCEACNRLKRSTSSMKWRLFTRDEDIALQTAKAHIK